MNRWRRVLLKITYPQQAWNMSDAEKFFEQRMAATCRINDDELHCRTSTSFRLVHWTCDVRFVPEAGVSHGSLFFSQFSIDGLGISPGWKRPALRKVMSGLKEDFIHIPQPQSSHQARSISFPLSLLQICFFGCGLSVWMSAVLTKRWAECIAPAHFRHSTQSGIVS